MLRTGMLVAVLGLAVGAQHFELVATFEPAPKAGSDGAIAVTFRALDPDVKLNGIPAPRLKLDLAQAVLEDRQAPAPTQVPDFDPLTAHYLDTRKPVLFPVAVARTAAPGVHDVKASVVFFYCSTREAWCRRGSVDVVVPVTVR